MVVAFVGCCNPVGEPDGTIGFLFTKQEIPTYCKTLKNKPIYLTHKHDLGPVGKIAKSWVENGKMMVAGVIHTDSLPAEYAGKGVLKGFLKGLSLGTIHGVLKNNSGKCTNILWRKIVDVSVCEEGDLPGTHILTMAAKEAVQEAMQDVPTTNFSPFHFFYSARLNNGGELPEILTKEKPLIGNNNKRNPSSQAYNASEPQTTFKMSTDSGLPPPPPQGKRPREIATPIPDIPAGLRNFAQRPTQAQQSMIDPRTLAQNEALRQPPAKKARTELTPSDHQKKPTEEATPADAAAADAAADGKKEESVPLGRQEYVDLLKAKAEKEDLEKKMLSMQEENKALKEKNQGWQTAAALSLGTNADSASLREQYNLANEERAKAAQIKVKEALKTGKEVKALLKEAGKTPSPGMEDGLNRLSAYNKDPRKLLNKNCRDDVMNLTGWLNDYNQARMLTVASGNKSTAQLEAKLQTTQARYKDLEEKQELKKIANGAQYSTPAPPTSMIPRSSGTTFGNTEQPNYQQQQQPKIPVPTQQQQQQYPDYEQTQDCWANAQSFQHQQTQQVLTTASSTSPGGGGTQGHYNSFYSKSSTPMSKVDPGPPLQRPPARNNIHINFTPFDTFYRAPISDRTSQYGAQLSRQLSPGTGQGRFRVPGFCGKDYGNGFDLPTKWRSDDQFSFPKGQPYAS